MITCAGRPAASHAERPGQGDRDHAQIPSQASRWLYRAPGWRLYASPGAYVVELESFLNATASSIIDSKALGEQHERMARESELTAIAVDAPAGKAKRS